VCSLRIDWDWEPRCLGGKSILPFETGNPGGTSFFGSFCFCHVLALESLFLSYLVLWSWVQTESSKDMTGDRQVKWEGRLVVPVQLPATGAWGTGLGSQLDNGQRKKWAYTMSNAYTFHPQPTTHYPGQKPIQCLHMLYVASCICIWGRFVCPNLTFLTEVCFVKQPRARAS